MEASRARGSCADPPPGRVIPITVFRSKQRHPLNAIFAPRSVAVIGATEKAGSVGRTLLLNPVSHPLWGAVYSLHPKGWLTRVQRSVRPTLPAFFLAPI